MKSLTGHWGQLLAPKTQGTRNPVDKLMYEIRSSFFLTSSSICPAMCWTRQPFALCIIPFWLAISCMEGFLSSEKQKTDDDKQTQTNVTFSLSFFRYPYSFVKQFSMECRKKSEITMVLLQHILWLVQKTRATFSTNQITRKIQPPPGRSRFPAFWAVCLFEI